MNFKFLNIPFPHIIIDDFFDENAHRRVIHEVFALQNSLKGPDMTGAARSRDNLGFKKRGTGVFLDLIYTDRTMSPTLMASNKLFSQELYDKLEECDWFFKYYYRRTTYDITLLQCYGDGDYYAAHDDDCIFTSITMIYKEPKQFEGGELCFPEHNNYYFDLKNNQTIIFPAKIPHEVLTVHKKTDDVEGNRFTISKFMSFKEKIQPEN